MTTTTHLCRQCRITPVNTEGTLCYKCAVKGGMPKPDYQIGNPENPYLGEVQAYIVATDGTTAIERFAAEKAQLASSLSEELNRVRTTQAAAAHALDTLRQLYGLDLIDGEHPAETAKRISAEKDAEAERLREAIDEVADMLYTEDTDIPHMLAVLQLALTGRE